MWPGGMSVSRLIRPLLQENTRQNRTYELAKRRYLARSAPRLNETDAPYPSRDELYDRSDLR